jgi:HD-GYP domain-containing protein (c-di-GMP phosphodiesterase class II)
MKLARPVYGQNGEMLLRKGAVLTARYIMSLRQCGILAVDIEGPVATEEENREILEEEVRCNAMNVVREWTQSNSIKNYEKIAKTVEVIIDEILSGKEVIGNLTEICSADMYTYAHSVDVCILSLTVGVSLGYKKAELLRLGVGGLLHDLGKTKVPADILNKPGKLTPAEFSEIKKHPVYGYKMLMEMKENIDYRSMSVVLDHHERYDGTGYPRGLKGSEIGEMAAVCAVADVYNAITTDRVYRKALPPHEAYEMIMASGGFMFESRVVDAFLKCVVPYPVGSVVRLSNGLVGNVCKLNQGLPFRPVVQIFNSQLQVDLKNENNLVITGLVRPEELREILMKGGLPDAAASPAGRVVRNS